MAQQEMSEEQIKELQEKIKNMSPEELREFQKKQCIFCQIILGKVQSKKIYEDDKSIAIMDINPANPGHVLLLPKEHYAIMPQLSEEEIAHIFMVAKTISNACLRALGVTGTNILVQNGVAAGQRAQHFMVHIIPRKENDGVPFQLPQKEVPEAALEQVRKKLESHLGMQPAKGHAGMKAWTAKPAEPKGRSAAAGFPEMLKNKLISSINEAQDEEIPGEKIAGPSEQEKKIIKSSEQEKKIIESSDPDKASDEAAAEKMLLNHEKKNARESWKSRRSGKEGEEKIKKAPGKKRGGKEADINLDDIARLLGS
ncbi:HIT domain-containing protein [Candidatus Woesearchaeota archaeon]|nr:HIT domain-containing protein [Candidatus Woesearchaeota archaeon]